MSAKEQRKITRSRKGCHNCKRLKIKCDEEKPECSNCKKSKAVCDYSLKLTWGGRPFKTEKKKKTPRSVPKFEFENFQPSKTQQQPGLDFSVTPALQLNNTPEPFGSVKSNSSARNRYDVFRVTDFRSPTDSLPFATYSPQELATRDTVELQPSKRAMLHNGVRSNEGLLPFFSASSTLTPESDQHIFKSLEQEVSLPNLMDRNRHGNNDAEIYQAMQASESITLQNNAIPLSLLSSLVESLPEISDGVESLSHALNKISGRSHQFNIRNSDMLNHYIQSHDDKSSIPDSFTGVDHDVTFSNRFEDNTNTYHFDDYSKDLAKIEAVTPKSPQNFIPDSLEELRSLFRGATRKRTYEESEDNIIELDDDHSISMELSSQASDSLLLTHVPTPSEVFSQVPPPLTPFPELLLRVPFYRSLMHFWVHVASLHLVPAPSHVYLDNPFKVILPQMAMEYPAILTTLLAFSASAKLLLTGLKDVPQIIIDQLLARSCNELLKLLKDKKEATSDATLATVLMLSSYEAFNSINFERSRAHTVGARQIVNARRLILPKADEVNSPDSDKSSESSGLVRGEESDIAYFLMRWFVYLDVIGALSATKNAHNYLTTRNYIDEGSHSIEIPPENAEHLPIDPKRDIDHLLGFDVNFLPLFSDVVLLIRKTDSYVEKLGGSSLPILIISKALELRDSIIRAYEFGEARRDITMDIIKDNEDDKKGPKRPPTAVKNLIHQHMILRCTNKVFCDMALLNLYRRVLLIPRESIIIQKLAKGIAKIIEENIEPKSTAEICSIFCLFCAACEVLDHDVRTFFEQRFTNMVKTGNTNAAKSLEIMNRCWQTGESWIQASKELDIDLMLL